MSWTLTTSGACINKAGYGANASVIASTAIMAEFSDMAEAEISTLTRKDWVTDYSSVKTNFKKVLSDLASDLVAMKIIEYDMRGFSQRRAETMLDVLRDSIARKMTALQNQFTQEVM